MTITSNNETITPTVAQQYLDTMQLNRAVRDTRVERYAAFMQLDHWVENGEAVKFDVRGELIDGQHRLLAIIRAGVAVRLLVVRGLPLTAQQTLDRQIVRGLVDDFRLAGYKFPAPLAAAAGWYFRLRATQPGLVPQKYVVPSPQQAQEIAATTGLTNCVADVSAWRAAQSGRICKAGVFSALYMLFGPRSRSFFEQTMTGTSPSPAVWLLRRTLLNERGSRDITTIAALVIKAYAMEHGTRTVPKLLGWRRSNGAEAFPDWRALTEPPE